MRLQISWLIAVVLALHGPALGQAVRPTDLAGTWMWRRDGGELFDSLKGQLIVTYLKIDSKGTFAYDGKIRKPDGQWRAYGVGWPKGTWALATDTLRLTNNRNSSAWYKVVLKEGRLLLWDWPMWDADRRAEKCAAKAFERFDASKPLTLPPLPQVTIQPTDLAGTWVGTFETRQWGTITDTLVFFEQGLRGVHHGRNPFSSNNYYDFGGWRLLPGDELVGTRVLRPRILLHNGELVFCSPFWPVLKRVGR